MDNNKMLSLITEDEYNMINDYRQIYTIGENTPVVDPAPIKEVLREWAASKSELCEAFGGKLILSKPIEIDSSDYICAQMDKFANEETVDDIKSVICKIAYDVYSDGIPGTCVLHGEYFNVRAIFASDGDGVFSADTLKTGIYNGEDFMFKDIHFRRGTRITKILQRIIKKYYNKDCPELKQFETEYSTILGAQALKGTLCLSIHPLDFLTMSDNNANWTSCLSVKHSGDWCEGAVEMMNSPYIVMAYIAADNSEMRICENSWNNKIWRELLLVTDDFLTCIKGYPFNSDKASAAALEMLAETLNTNKNTAYQNSNISLEDVWLTLLNGKIPCTIETNIMYNDFYTTGTNHIIFLNNNNLDLLNKEDCVYINYSGYAQCLWCGKEIDYISGEHFESDYEDGSRMICDECRGIIYCDDCHDELFADEAIKVGDCMFCEVCAQRHLPPSHRPLQSLVEFIRKARST